MKPSALLRQPFCVLAGAVCSVQGVCSMFISAFSAYTKRGRVSVTHLLFVAEIGFTIPDVFV
jgi:hypothetical protein